MTIAKAEWWERAMLAAEPKISVADRLDGAVRSILAAIGGKLLYLVDPPYPTPDGKPLEVKFYDSNDSQPFTQEQTQQLIVFARMLEGKTSKG